MALIKGTNFKPRPIKNRSDHLFLRRKYKVDYRPKEKYSTTTKEVGGFVLHEVQVVSPQSLKTSYEKKSSIERHVPAENELESVTEDITAREPENIAPVIANRIKSPSNPFQDSLLLDTVVKKKRGRPRKNPIDSSTANANMFMSIDEDTFNAEMLAQLSPAPQDEQSDPSPLAWSPLQRLFQLNQALACVEHYRDESFWDKIYTEFFNPDSRFKLMLGSGKCYDLPSFVGSKLFWVWAQCGLERLNFCWDSITETMGEDGTIQVLCQHAKVCSYSENNTKHLVQPGSHSFVFTFSSKLREFCIKIENFIEFSATKNLALQFGFDNSMLLFLEVASVMTSVLPDCTSWLTWFQSYCQQNSYISSNSLSVAQQAQREAAEEHVLFSMDIQSLESPAFNDFGDINLNNFINLNEPIDIPLIVDSVDFDFSALESADINESYAPDLDVVNSAVELESLIKQKVEIVETQTEGGTTKSVPEHKDDDDFFDNYM